MEGYNCAQAIAGAYASELGMEEKRAVRLASGFGAGIGGMRGVCGALSGLMLVYGFARGYDEAADMEGKKRLYACEQAMAKRFTDTFEALHCPRAAQARRYRGHKHAQRAHAGVLQKAPVRKVHRNLRAHPGGRAERAINLKNPKEENASQERRFPFFFAIGSLSFMSIRRVIVQDNLSSPLHIC